MLRNDIISQTILEEVQNIMRAGCLTLFAYHVTFGEDAASEKCRGALLGLRPGGNLREYPADNGVKSARLIWRGSKGLEACADYNGGNIYPCQWNTRTDYAFLVIQELGACQRHVIIIIIIIVI